MADFAFSGGPQTSGDASDADSFKVRRGKVGGFADYFDADQQRQLNEMVRTHLS